LEVPTTKKLLELEKKKEEREKMHVLLWRGTRGKGGKPWKVSLRMKVRPLETVKKRRGRNLQNRGGIPCQRTGLLPEIKKKKPKKKERFSSRRVSGVVRSQDFP